MRRKKWTVSKVDKEYVAEISEKYSLNPFAALLLVSRNFLGEQETEDFLSGETVYMSDPFELPDMEKAADRIRKAIVDFEKIVIYGDYDADGVTSTALLYSYLSSKGADVSYYIPDRNSEGYGMHTDSVRKIAEMGTKLIITVDNGISAFEEAKLIKELGMDLVITDHHRPGDDLPDAVAVVDAYRKDYPGEFKDWAGVGIAYKLAEAIEGDDSDELLEEYSDFVSIGTIGDVTPLFGENRQFVKSGTAKINQRSRIGIEALKEALDMKHKEFNALNIAFTIVPKINAAGRMGDASRALKLLMSNDEAEAKMLAEEIIEANSLRQKAEQSIIDEAKEIFQNHPEYLYDRVIVVDGDEWHGGVIGIVAARIVEEYGKPCLVISKKNGVGKGSGRSIEGFSLFDMLCETEEILNHFGGHTLAAGFEINVDKIDEFRRKVNEYAAKREMPFAQLDIDCKINPKYIDVDLLDALSFLEPYGAGNKQPIFGLYKMRIDKVEPVSNGKHCKITMSRGDVQISAMKFGISLFRLGLFEGDVVDVAAILEKNDFLGRIKAAVYIKDIRFSGMDEDAIFESYALYDKIKRGEDIDCTEAFKAIPTRDIVARVYKMMRKYSAWSWPEEYLDYRIGDNGEKLCAVLVAIDMLEELGLVRRDIEHNSVKIIDSKEKVDLDNSSILQRLKGYLQ